MRRLRSFGDQGEMLCSFYESVVATVLFYAVVCWGSGIRISDANRLNKLIKKNNSVLGTTLDPWRW